ncbi:MAG: AAA family ATPase [Ilumatobacter sp.]
MLVLIDGFARSLVGADENRERGVGLAVEHRDMIRRAAGSRVLIVDHAGKDASKGARGSSALKAAMDTEIEVIGSEAPIVDVVTEDSVRNTFTGLATPSAAHDTRSPSLTGYAPLVAYCTVLR